ncbi:SDR family oxidoreductase [Rhodococcoides kyotonense]|uniref:NAD(P)-dependent dehydrogenase, short-chain alcohol dehydrogenase family n=1 Tax=Rhodococcoides kyotonense TaxID=398843 RepID=A0A239IT02_9NOCA|nr:SDR family oxidoreductase [Rhodococcus kyotonensis]SNS96760.1 NAD(P)-dependent dehydrogenase, short-chain alcohol dehydrogenase family [Rhodococcus kyotonensis]
MTLVVTGAASGIGLALVRRALGAGIEVWAVDRNACPEPAAKTVLCDLSDPDEIATLELPRHIDMLACVAGVPGTAPPELVLAVNTLGMRLLTGRCLGAMASGARIVNVASVAAHRNTVALPDIATLLSVTDKPNLDTWLAEHPLDGPAAYDTSKRAVLEWTSSLAAHLIPRGIGVVSVSPGPTETPILTDFTESMGAESIDRSAAAVGRHGTADEIAAVVHFFLSPAASWTNGIDIPVEGGLLATRSALLSDALKGLDS